MPSAWAWCQDARAVILQANLKDPRSRQAIERLNSTDAGAGAARGVLAEGVSGDALWAATYLYASGSGDPGPLRPLLKTEDVSIRVLAGAGLVTRGDVSGFDALVDGLRHREPFRGSSPPTPVWTVATAVLVRMTAVSRFGPRWDFDERRLAVAHRRWRAWLEENRRRLRFNRSTGEWNLP
jgi:hypothetical protein